jgi:hypothetical protein
MGEVTASMAISRLDSRVLSTLTIAVSAVLLSQSVAIAQPGVPSRVQRLQSFTRAAFPELSGMKATLTIETGLSVDWASASIISFRLEPANVWPPPRTAPELRQDPFLGGSAVVGPEYIESVSLGGEYVNSRLTRELVKRAEEHPSWTDTDLQEAIVELHGKFGPMQREAFVQQLALDRFSAVLGNTKPSRITFAWRFGRPDLGRDDISTPQWAAYLENAEPNRGSLCSVLLFEPFDGRLTALLRHPCPK